LVHLYWVYLSRNFNSFSIRNMQFIWNRQLKAKAVRVPTPAPQVEDVQVAHIPEPEPEPPKVVEPQAEPEPEPEPPKVVEPEPAQEVALPEQEETAPES
jgi:hypothetical protein